jgi:HK97 family phage major capsid protein
MQMAEDLAKFIDYTALFSTLSSTAHAYDSVFWNGIWQTANVNEANLNITTGGTGFAATLTYANLKNAITKLNELTAEGAEWYMSPQSWSTIRGLNASFPVYNGVTTSPITLSEATLPLIPLTAPWQYPLFGFPVNITSRFTTTAAASTPVALLGNLKWLYFGDRMQFGIDTSEHYLFLNDEVVFRALQRFAVGVPIPFAFTKLTSAAA